MGFKMSSKVEISNLALSHVGVGKHISNIETEKTEEATTCKLMYPVALGYLLENYRWPKFVQTPTLALVSENPTSEWAFAYRRPNDAARILRLVSGYKVDTPETRILFTEANDDAGTLIYTDQPEAQAEIVIKDPDPRFFSSSFAMALSYKLAILIAPRLAGGDVFQISERLTLQTTLQVLRRQDHELNGPEKFCRRGNFGGSLCQDRYKQICNWPQALPKYFDSTSRGSDQQTWNLFYR
jgi:hypothetical protein